MKQTHEYNTNFNEYQKALLFLKEGCDCGCYHKVPQEKFAKIRADFQVLSKTEQDAFLMAQLISMVGGEETTSSRFPKKERTNHRIFYRWNHNTLICQETYLNMLGISRKYLENIKEHLLSKGLLTRVHGNTGRMPQWKTKMVVDQDVKATVKEFLEKYAEEYGLPSPGRTKRGKENIVFLPTDMTYKSVHVEFLNNWESIDNPKPMQLKYVTFLRIWHEVTPNIKLMSPRSDLCDTCHQLRNKIHSCQDETAKKELKKKS